MAAFMESKTKSKWQKIQNPRIANLQKLLSSLQNHLLAHFSVTDQSDVEKSTLDSDILNNHLKQLFTLGANIFTKAAEIVETHPSSLELLYNVLLDSVAGSMLFKILSSLLLIPSSFAKNLLNLLLEMLDPLDRFTQLLPIEILIDNDKDSSSRSTISHKILLGLN